VLAWLLLLSFGPIPLVGWLGDRALRSLEERQVELAFAEARAELGEALAEALAKVEEHPDGAPPMERSSVAMPLRSDASGDPTAIALQPEGEALVRSEVVRAARLADEGRVGEALEALGQSMRADDPRVRAVGLLQAAEVVRGCGPGECATELARRAEEALREDDPDTWTRWARARRARLEADEAGAASVVDRWLGEVRERPTSLEELALLGDLVTRLAADGAATSPGAAALAEALAERRAWPRWRRLLLSSLTAREPRSAPALLPASDGWFLVRGGDTPTATRLSGLGAWIEAWRGESGARAWLLEGGGTVSDRRTPITRCTELPDASHLPIDLGKVVVSLRIAPPELFGDWNPRVLLFGALAAYAALGLLALRALLARERQARKLAATRGDLIAEVTHELRTPLTVLRLYAESLLGKRVPPAAEREYLGTIERESVRLGELVDRVAAAARDEEVPPAEAHALDPEPIVEGVTRELRALVERDGGSLVFTGCGGPARIVGDEEELRRVVEVLVENAVRYSPPPARVEVATRLEAERWVCTVRDHGPGWPTDPRERERLLERWTRGKGAPGRGAGMGLYLARSGAGTLGGTLTLEDAEGGGAVARLELPRARGAEGGDA